MTESERLDAAEKGMRLAQDVLVRIPDVPDPVERRRSIVSVAKALRFIADVLDDRGEVTE